jgi:hypothetical protein
MRTSIFFALPFIAVACSDVAASPDAAIDRPSVTDAGVDATTSDVATDLPVDAPATTPQYDWREATVMGSGPYGRWGYMVAERGDGTALIQGGTNLTAGGAGRVFNETWTFDGRADPPTFARLTTTGSPPSRYCGCVGYDPRRQVLLMVGGRTPDVSLPETWALDLASLAWSRVMAPESPPGVIGCAMAWSEARGALYLFGGASSAGYVGRTWRFDATAGAWVALEAMGPRARYDAVMKPVEGGRAFVMFGGSRNAAAAGPFFADVWRFDTMTEEWSEFSVTGSAPEGRRTPWVMFEPGERTFVAGFGAHGIQAGENYDDLWRFDLTSRQWTRVTFAKGATLPSARGFIQALPGGANTLGWLLGGFDNASPINDLWRLGVRGGGS